MADEYEVEIRIRNNLLKSRRVARGMTGADVAEAAGMSHYTYSGLECMRVAPMSPATGKWRPSARRLCVYYQCEPEELFPMGDALEQPVLRKTVSDDQMRLICNRTERLTYQEPLDVVAEEDEADDLRAWVATLDAREQEVVNQRYGLDGGGGRSLKEIGDDLGYTKERMRQVEAKAIRRLQNRYEKAAALWGKWTPEELRRLEEAGVFIDKHPVNNRKGE